MSSAAQRIELIGSVARMRRVQCNLRVIDSPVTLDERVDAVKLHGGSEEEAEELRYKACLYQRSPKDMAADQVDTLDLSSANLSILKLHEYKNLKKLVLRNNRISDSLLLEIGLEEIS
eukprot:232703_1